MAESKDAECDFALRGLKFRYQKNFKAFVCESGDMLAILRRNYPACYETVVQKYPELKTMSEERGKVSVGKETIEGWKEADIREMKDETAQVKDGKDEEEQKMAGKRKPGMISKLSKGIKKIIATITPTKLRKRWHLEDEEAEKPVNGPNSPTTAIPTAVTEPSIPVPPPSADPAGKS
jgi:hypothetical protein